MILLTENKLVNFPPSVMFFSFDAPLLCDDKSSMGVVTKITPGGIESSSSSVSESSLSVSV